MKFIAHLFDQCCEKPLPTYLHNIIISPAYLSESLGRQRFTFKSIYMRKIIGNMHLNQLEVANRSSPVNDNMPRFTINYEINTRPAAAIPHAELRH